ncbi:hypothetical protein JHK86_048158 [Glycine max]|nr:hypothetical protein JHK86_048158 [Glycine max]
MKGVSSNNMPRPSKEKIQELKGCEIQEQSKDSAMSGLKNTCMPKVAEEIEKKREGIALKVNSSKEDYKESSSDDEDAKNFSVMIQWITHQPLKKLSQPERPNLSIKGNPNPSTNHTNTSSKHPSLNPTFFYFQTLCLLSQNGEQPSRAKKKVKTSKRKQGESSQAALKKLDTWFTSESKKNDYKMIYAVKNIGIAKYLDLEWFSQQGFNFPNLLEAQGK